MDYEKKSIEELETMNLKLTLEVDAIKSEQRKLKVVLDHKIIEARAKEKFDAMSDSEKAVLNQMIKNAGNIASGEKFDR